MDNEQAILRDVLAGNSRRYGALIDLHKDRAMTLAVRLVGDRGEAEELVQDAFLRAYRNLDTFRGDAKFGTWFYRILYNLCMTKVTRRKPKPESIDDKEDGFMNAMIVDREDVNALEQMEGDELQSIIGEEIRNLPEKYRTAVTLFYIQEMNYEEICATLDMPVGTVKTYLFRGRNILRDRVLQRTRDEVKVA
ncbi:MAG: sigma-70 family RNA polymerase sigma factor [Bacteroidota bacterium]